MWIFFWFVILALANIRAVSINTVFYQGFQLLPWYGVFLFLTQLVTISLLKTNRRAGIIFSFGLLIIFVRYITSPAVFFREHISPHEELITNYATEIQIGNVVRELSNPSDTFFLDGWGELIFWQANRLSPYRYSWYTSVMPLIPLYNEARKEMFTTNPPDFYFGSCPKEQNKERILPELVQPLYVNLSSGGNPTCLWVKKEKLAQITPNQWKKSQELLFDTPISHVQRNELPEVH